MPDYSTKQAKTKASQVLESGLTRREEFAIRAMQGMLTEGAFDPVTEKGWFARKALLCADALIEELYGSDE